MVGNQPPSGGCVLKHDKSMEQESNVNQPPSGGCVLKPALVFVHCRPTSPAAFGRLCVETEGKKDFVRIKKPAAFGRLCVETHKEKSIAKYKVTSRLRAAVC